MISCKACSAPMPMTYMDEKEEHLEILCDGCKTKAAQAVTNDQYRYEGLWWDMHWSGHEEYLAREWPGENCERDEA